MTSKTGASPRSRESAGADKTDPREEYVENIDILDDVIEVGLYKLVGDGRFADPDIEQARWRCANTVIKAIKERRMNAAELEREEMAERIEALEERLATASEGRVRAKWPGTPGGRSESWSGS